MKSEFFNLYKDEILKISLSETDESLKVLESQYSEVLAFWQKTVGQSN